MSHVASSIPTIALPPIGSRENSWLSVTSFVIAVMIHATIAISAPREEARPSRPIVTEIDLAPLPPAPPPPPPPVEEKPASPQPEPTSPTAPTLKAAAPVAPMAARAGALLTARDDAPKTTASEAPVEFVTDPNGTSYGGGVVARGGTSDFGEKGANATGTPSATAATTPIAPARKPDDIVAPGDLSRQAKLSGDDACRGFFPAAASVDSALVTVALVVRANGAVSTASVVSETPPGQGFGAAARSCMLSSRFAAALDREGKSVTSATTVRVRFTR